MKTLIIIFGLLYAVHCKPSDYNDYMEDAQNDDENYDDPVDEDNVPANEQVVFAISEGETFERNLGEAVLLPCVFSGSDDYVRLWKKGEAILYQSLVRMGASNNTQEMKNGTLYITNLTGNDDGQYVCSALIYTDQEKNPTIVHTLRVIRPPQIESLTSKDNRVILQSGSTLSLHCQATGYPTPNITWHKNGKRFAEEGEYFTLIEVKHHNAGRYSCMADNKIGNPDVKTIDIKVEHKPLVAIDHISVNSAISEETELVCTVHAEPNAEIVWKKGGVNIKNSDRHALFSEKNDHVLVIKNLEESDFGVYTCSATNYLGTTNKNITLAKTAAIVGFREPKVENRELVLLWEVQSKTPITAHELQYRKKGESKWHTVNPESNTKDNELYIVKYALKGLDPGDYETRIKSFNAHGWSEYSEIKTFKAVHAKTGHNKAHKKSHGDGKDKQITTPEPTRPAEPSQNIGEPAEHQVVTQKDPQVGDKQITTPEPTRPAESSQNTGEPTEHQVVTQKDPQVGANESSGCSSLTSTVTLLNVALIVIFLVRPPTIRI